MSQREIWKALSGVLCIYKHSGISSSALKKLVTNKITESVAEVESTSRLRLPIISLPVVEPHETSGALVVVGRNELPDYRYHPLVCGRSIRTEDVQLLDALPLATISSGVCLLGINDGCEKIPDLMAATWTNRYRIDGIFGKTDNEQQVSISRHRMEKLIIRMESEFRSATFQNANVDLESSEAFEMARRGLPRGQLPGAQNVFSIELNHFKPPRFSITVQCAGEDDEMLRSLISEMGVQLDSNLQIFRLQRQNFGPFSSEDALLEKQLCLQNIVRNIQKNRKIITSSLESIDKKVITEQTEIAEKSDIFDGFGVRNSTSLEEYDAMRPAWPRNY